MATTFRADTRAGLYTALVAFRTAQPSRLSEVYRVRPAHYNVPMPLAWVDLLSESASHTSGTRERVLSPSVVFMGEPIENDEQVTAWDALVDLAADHFTDYAHISANTIWDRWVITDETEEVESAGQVRLFPIVRFTFQNVSIREGRS